MAHKAPSTKQTFVLVWIFSLWFQMAFAQEGIYWLHNKKFGGGGGFQHKFKSEAQIIPLGISCLGFPLDRSHSRSLPLRRWQKGPLVDPGVYFTHLVPPLGGKMSFPTDSAKVPRQTCTGQAMVICLSWQPEGRVGSAQTTWLEERVQGGSPRRRDAFSNEKEGC